MKRLPWNIDEIQKQIEAGAISAQSGRELITRLDSSRNSPSETLERYKVKGCSTKNPPGNKSEGLLSD